MKTCHTCDFFRKANEEGGQCHLNPPKIFLIPVEKAPQMAPGGKLLAAGGVGLVPGAYWPAVRVTDGCSHHMPKTSEEERLVPPIHRQ